MNANNLKLTHLPGSVQVASPAFIFFVEASIFSIKMQLGASNAMTETNIFR